MKIEQLTDEELKMFLNGIPVELFRDIYTNANPLKKKLKGFSNPNKATKAILVNTSYQLIKKEKNQLLISILTDKYNEYVYRMKDIIKNLQEFGYSEEIAHAVAVKDVFNPSFRKVFYKLEELSDEEQQRIDKNIDFIEMVDIRAGSLIKKSVNPETDKRIEALEKGQESFEDSVKDLNRADEKQVKAINEIDAKIVKAKKELLEAISSRVTEEQLNKKVEAVLAKLNKELKEMTKNDEVKELKNEIKGLKDKIAALPQVQKEEIYEYDHIKQGDFSPMEDCEFLNEDIQDVVEPVVKSSSVNTLIEYIVETLYGNKPIITTTKMVDLVADIYASIMTGGEYYSIDIGENYSSGKLIHTIEKITNDKENSVVVIRGLINVFNYRTLISYLSSHPFSHKFVFDIHYEKEVKFLPIDALNDFYFLFGDLSNKQIEYRYTHPFKERKAIKNGDYEKALSQIGIDLDDKTIFNVKFQGIFSFSFIPFIAAHNGVEKEEVLSLILDGNVRRQCEAAFDD